MRICLALIAILFATNAWSQACIIESGTGAAAVKVCQQNRSIPEHIFKNGFCKPRLAGQNSKVTFVERCPTGAFGTCRNAQTAGTPYQQDIYYYGNEGDARFLQPACQRQSKGVWVQGGPLF